MWVLSVRTWIKALLIVSALEFVASALMGTRRDPTSFVGHILVLYHILSIPFGQAVLIWWNSPAHPEPASGSNAVYWISVYAFQVVLTFPIAYALLRCVHLRRQKAAA